MRIAFLVLPLAFVAGSALAAPAKPAASKPPAPKAASLDARDPASMTAYLAGLGAKAEAAPRQASGQVTMKVTTPGGMFGAQFVNCDAKGKACAGVAFSTEFGGGSPTLAQLNLFNRTQFACRGYLGANGKANVMYSTILSARTSADDMKQHLSVWQGCLSAFGSFTRDPVAYLASTV